MSGLGRRIRTSCGNAERRCWETCSADGVDSLSRVGSHLLLLSHDRLPRAGAISASCHLRRSTERRRTLADGHHDIHRPFRYGLQRQAERGRDRGWASLLLPTRLSSRREDAEYRGIILGPGD